MTHYIFSTPPFLQPFQTRLNALIQGAPDDAVFAGFKSHIGSAAATLAMSRRNLFSSLASQPLALVSSLTYTLCMSALKKADKEQVISLQEHHWTLAQLGSAGVGITASHVFARRLEIHHNLLWSIVFTASSHFVMHLFPDSTLKTPVFFHVVV
jgi:hypothetical protein